MKCYFVWLLELGVNDAWIRKLTNLWESALHNDISAYSIQRVTFSSGDENGYKWWSLPRIDLEYIQNHKNLVHFPLYFKYAKPSRSIYPVKN